MRKAVSALLSVSVLSLSMVSGVGKAHAAEGDVINEKWGKPVFVYGEALTTQQKLKTLDLLKSQEDNVKSVSVNGKDLVKYLGEGDPSSKMYSSALIERTDKGSGVKVSIVTEENITEVTENQYANAMITAGVSDADVKVASPIKVTGESALTGIYKAYEAEGETLDKDRMEAAQNELDVTTRIAGENKNNKDFNTEQLNQALIDIKSELAKLKEDQDKLATPEQIEKIVNDALKDNDLGGVITNDQVSQLVDMANKYQNTKAIDSAEVKKQLNDLADQVKDKLSKLKDKAEETGFFQKIGDAIMSLFSAIAGLFS